MFFEKEVLIVVNGKTVRAKVCVTAPEVDDCDDGVNPQMVLTAVANNQDMFYRSRDHQSRDVQVKVLDIQGTSHAADMTTPKLRLVA